MIIVHLISKKLRTKFSFIIPNQIYKKKTPNEENSICTRTRHRASCACMHALANMTNMLRST